MGYKYTLRFKRNGLCDYEFDWGTNSFLKALFWFFKLKLKYHIITFEIRTGYIPCEECDADWCEKSPAGQKIS